MVFQKSSMWIRSYRFCAFFIECFGFHPKREPTDLCTLVRVYAAGSTILGLFALGAVSIIEDILKYQAKYPQFLLTMFLIGAIMIAVVALLYYLSRFLFRLLAKGYQSIFNGEHKKKSKKKMDSPNMLEVGGKWVYGQMHGICFKIDVAED